MQNRHIKKVTRQTKTKPPITPPAIGPAALEDELGVDEGEGANCWHMVTGQESQPCPMREQTSLAAQAGHGGGCWGQFAHLLNSFGEEKSASVCCSATRRDNSDDCTRGELTKSPKSPEIESHLEPPQKRRLGDDLPTRVRDAFRLSRFWTIPEACVIFRCYLKPRVFRLLCLSILGRRIRLNALLS